MKQAIIVLTDGFEEAEALVTADILRRAGVGVALASLTGNSVVTGSHDIKVTADCLFTDDGEADLLVLPGGPGAAAFASHAALTEALIQRHERGAYIAAICAAPLTLGRLGLLRGKAATCYTQDTSGDMPDGLNAARYSAEPVVTDGHIITARGPGAAYAFGLALAGLMAGADEARRVKDAMLL